MALVVGDSASQIAKINGHTLFLSHFGRYQGLGITCSPCLEREHSGPMNPCKPMTQYLMEMRDTPFTAEELSTGVLLPLLRAPKIAHRLLKRGMTKPEGDPTHLIAKVDFSESVRNGQRGVWVEIPGLADQTMSWFGTINKRFDGRWTLRDMILNWIVSQYREAPTCIGEYHYDKDFGEGDKRIKDPTTPSIILNTLFITLTQECVTCSLGALIPES